MNQQELIARLQNIYVWSPKSSITLRDKIAELIRMVGGRVPETYSERPAEEGKKDFEFH